MAVGKRRKSRIVVNDETYYWSVDHIPGDDFPTLAVVSPDKSLCFHYPIDAGTHRGFLDSMKKLNLFPPTPGISSELTADRRNPAFSITPKFVRELIEWCVKTECMQTPDWYSIYIAG